MGTAQARVVMSVLVLGLLGGSAELARCPQLVSFSRAALPVAAGVRSSSDAGSAAVPGYVPASFRRSGNAPGAAHETLLKATMPMDNGDRSIPIRPAGTTPVKHRRAVVAPAVQRSRQNRAAVQQQVHGWVMLTSWEEPEQPGMALPIARPEFQERVISISYAAVPTAGGWLVIQL
jgi:hypothetical protein